VPTDQPTSGARPHASARRSAAEAAFERYVLPEMEVMLRVATSITHDPVDAEDLVQETVIRAYRAIERFDGRHPRAWLLTIMRNAQINRVRRRRPELMRDPDATMARMADAGEGGESAEALVVGRTFDAVVERAFRSLPEKFRLVVELVDLDGLAYQEAADVLDIPVGTVMSRLHRARNRIRDQLVADDLAPRRPR
jgi:RNA polymerase sigma-70 factor (ECF subfamily)